MNITINQLVAQFEDFATRHKMINDYGFGSTHQIGETRKMNYPYLWVTLQPSTIVNNEGRLGTVEMDFTFIVADYLNNVISNELGQESYNGLETISDLQGILFDFISELNGNTFYNNNRINLKSNVTFSPSWDERDDKVNAMTADVTITMPFNHTYCESPVTLLGATASINRNC